MITILWVLILLAGFYMAWSIGANDVANAMGTSVGSGALRLKQAIVVAAVLEFSGAFFFGSHVSETMQKGILNIDFFANDPMSLVLGMLAALIGTGIWLQLASYFGWPVSTTHTIVGSIVGFGVLYGGFAAVDWEKVLFITVSWVLSPIFGGIFGFFIFNMIRQQILYAKEPLKAAEKLMPFFSFCVFALLSLLFLYNGLENLDLNLGYFDAFLWSLCIGILAAIITKLLIHRTLAKQPIMSSEEHTKKDFDLIEKMFGWLQIFSACLMAFAHGANDVANAIGPLSAALQILDTGTLALQAEIPPWTLALGGFGIVVGLATWGWRVIETIGKKITELTPTRGFSAEFGAAATILVASRLGMPISTTHTLVGAVIGVGLARGLEALNMGMTRDILASWLVTIPAGAIMTLVIYLGLFSIFHP